MLCVHQRRNKAAFLAGTKRDFPNNYSSDNLYSYLQSEPLPSSSVHRECSCPCDFTCEDTLHWIVNVHTTFISLVWTRQSWSQWTLFHHHQILMSSLKTLSSWHLAHFASTPECSLAHSKFLILSKTGNWILTSRFWWEQNWIHPDNLSNSA